MDADRWQQRISRLYHEALERPGDQRDALLEHVGLKPGVTLGTYQIERPLGRGGMGVVFLAHDATLHREVALKVLESPTDDGTARARLLREARNAAALNHPNICTVYEVGEADGCAFIAMEYVEGRPLSDRLAESALPLEEALLYGIEATHALSYAHDHGVIHRDLKAANAIVTMTGRLKLIDFGLARREDALLADATTMPSLAAAGIAVGTPYSMAPEQVRGAVTDPRTDIWAIGVLLYEMVGGTKPFGGATIPELFSSILRDAPAPLPNTVPTELKLVIERCLEKEPARRYEHAGEVRAALEAVQAGTTPRWVTWRAGVKRLPWVASGVAGLAVAALLVGLDVGSLRERFGGSPPAANAIKLAVLPFENLTGDPEQEYFSDGLTDEMITQLGRLRPQRLSVIARTSSMRYKKRDLPVDQIGRELSVDYVLEGSARRDGNRVRINATLIQVRDQTQLWADSFDRELAGILALQSDVARSVAASLRLTLLPSEQTRLASARSVNPEAYEAYLKGRFHAEKETQADLDLALEYFELALQKDPRYAPAYAGVVMVWNSRNQNGYVPPSEATPKARAAATKALEVDGALAVAHYALASVAWAEWDWKTNEMELRRAIELDPNDPSAPAFYAHLLIALKRPDEAVSQAERSMQLDPLNAFNQALYGTVLYFVRRYDDALVEFQRALRTTPESSVAQCGLWYTYNMKRAYEQALIAAQSCLNHDNSQDVKDVLARGYSAAGYTGAMQQIADRLAAGLPGMYVSPIEVFSTYLYAGRKDLALEWLSKSIDARDPNVYGAVRDPFVIDSLGDDPRFQNILRRTGLPN
jgi:eukaryotic-like serine/threonine-protein kinase